MTDCLFCKIAAKTLPAEILHEDDRALAFRDLNPQAPLHALVIPRVHIRTIDEILPEHEGDVGHLFTIASKIAAAEGLGERGYRVVMNCKGEAGQSVYHVHLHVLGGRPLGWPPFPKH
jgi:histidine triad (HIT) family protein